MNTAVSNFAWEPEDNDKVYQQMEQMGITGLEFAPLKLFGEEPYSKAKTRQAVEYFKGLWERYGIRPVSVQSIWSGCQAQLLGSPREREILREQTLRVLDYAAELECPVIMWGSGACRSHSDYGENENNKVAREFFLPLADYAKERDITIAVEAVNAYYESRFLVNSIESLNFVQECNHSHIRFNFDTGMMQMEKETLEDYLIWQKNWNIESWISLVGHVHISEPRLVTVELREYQKELAASLQNYKYQGYISLEMGDAGLENLFSSMEVLKQFQ